MLPRILLIIYEINDRFLKEVRERYPNDAGRMARMSIVEENGQKLVRMAHLAIIGSHSINGVSRIHSDILREKVFWHFCDMYPERFNNKTNGITQRRWLKKTNHTLSRLITEHIGPNWITDLDELQKLRPLAEDAAFIAKWQKVKQDNKQMLAEHILKHNCVEINVDSLFDCQVKRIHEYKRQLLNVLHIVTHYNRIKANPSGDFVPRTFIFSGKAAPSYFLAKLIIRLISAVGGVVNNDPEVGDRLKVVFLANYCVTLAERIFPASDLSEQISTAGTEASGTGNMKFGLNGALTIGTLDGANVEILDEVGKDNIFIFGLTAPQVDAVRAGGYNPYNYYHHHPELKKTLDMISGGYFASKEPDLFKPITDSLLNQGDHYLVLADYASYVACQEEVSELYKDRDAWARKSILNVAGMGRFSSDRTIAEYACDIWDSQPVKVCPILEFRQRMENLF